MTRFACSAIKDLGETKLGDHDAYLAVASCGKVNSSTDGHSETALIVAVKGAAAGVVATWDQRRGGSGSAS